MSDTTQLPTMDVAQLPWLASSWRKWQQILSRGTVAHAWLLAGAEGIGKASFADSMTQSLLCERHSGCGQCRSCLLLKAGNHPDRFEIAPDGKQIKVESIRALITQLSQTANQGGARVVILQQADTMNQAAANALLKTLEEPMAGVYLILVSANPKRLLPTIHSRCQSLLLPSPSLAQSQALLGQSVPDALLSQQLRVFGGPLSLKQAIESGDAELAAQCRDGWKQSLKLGVLAPVLMSLDSDKAPLALKVLYIELAQWQRHQIHETERWHGLSVKTAELYQRFANQSGLNHIPLFQELIA
ncbi:DNA polymerase III subunit delta' [Ferrimonas aestuarii]|uniref:DNA-directed DNA polymerase n=1 Tax=Ferrimonas aestuarii TaxID=2569539 RepID=A0A4U1BSB5_9GAMM|nr:DNA polymerase III subunit delta' [Ferrimonas aestuarii]TKB57496.1 DNA polymerase III subunit delta' [Ferrimonas aestuarii]